MSVTSCLQPDYLKNLAIQYREKYAQAKPFPHVVIDNFLPEYVLDTVLAEFPNAHEIKWQTFDKPSEKKLASSKELQMGEATRALLYQFNSSTFIDFLETLTGIEGIIPDPHFEGGGLHQIQRGGFLKMHVDFNLHTRLRLDRRLNMLVYLNKDWAEEYGGYLELWDQNMTQCEQKILPIFNRCVVFGTTDFSYHGHPEPLNCPEDRTRKSLALYYYSNGRPASELKGEGSHSTIFQARPTDTFDPNESSGVTAKDILKKLVPPILIDVKNAFKK